MESLERLKDIFIDGEAIYISHNEGEAEGYNFPGFNSPTKVVKVCHDIEHLNSWDTSSASVVVQFEEQYYKSHQYSGSYGVPAWTEWALVNPVPVITYKYVETPY